MSVPEVFPSWHPCSPVPGAHLQAAMVRFLFFLRKKQLSVPLQENSSISFQARSAQKPPGYWMRYSQPVRYRYFLIGFQSDLNDPFLLRKGRYCTGHTMDLHSCYDQFTQFPHLMIPESQNVGLHFLLYRHTFPDVSL